MAKPDSDGIGDVGLLDELGNHINPATAEGQSAAAGLIDVVYDYIAVAYPLATTEVYTFKSGGAGGSTVATVTLVYTDATKSYLSTATKT